MPPEDMLQNTPSIAMNVPPTVSPQEWEAARQEHARSSAKDAT